VTLPDVIADADVTLATDAETLARCIDAFLACAAACTACSAACLAEEGVADLRDCIATDDVCAEVCTATARVAARIAKGSWDVLRAQLEACLVACQRCGADCRQHADMHDHCRACAEACERGETAARTLLDAIPS
jgi:hypothetical protein